MAVCACGRIMPLRAPWCIECRWRWTFWTGNTRLARQRRALTDPHEDHALALWALAHPRRQAQ